MAQPTEIQSHFLDYWRIISNRKALIIAIFCLVMIAAAVATALMPKIYRATASLEIRTEAKTVVLNQVGASMPLYDSAFLNTQIENIQAKDVLYPVIDLLGLSARWGKRDSYEGGTYSREVTYLLLKNMIDVAQKRNTSFVDLRVESRSREEAVEVCNAIANAYARNRLELAQRASEAGLSNLREAVKRQENARDAAQAEVERLRKELQIMPMAGQSPVRGGDVASSMEEVVIQKMKSDLSDARGDLIARKQRYESVKDLSSSEFINSLSTLGIQASEVLALQTSMLNAEADLTQLRKQGYGEEHPKIASAAALATKLRQQLEAQANGLRQGMKVDVDVAEARARDLESKVREKEAAIIDLQKTNYGPYREAVRKFEAEEEVFQTLSARLKQKAIEEGVPQIPVIVRNPAEALPYAVKPRLGLNLALAGLVGLVLAVAAAFFVEYLDTSVKSMDDIERQVGLPVLAVIPKGVPPLNRDVPDSPHAEGYRILRTKIEFSRKDDSMNTLTLVSGGPGEGKSTTLFNLAWVCAMSGLRTLIVDADLRRPTLHHILGVKNECGLADLLLGNPPLDQVIMPTPLDNLHFLPSGANASQAIGFLNSARMLEIIADLKVRYDWVFFDSPPILGVSDAAVLARELDCTAMVVQHRRYPVNISLRVKQAILDVGGNLLGVVMNQVDTAQDETYGYYNSYYNYYNEKGTRVKKRRTTLGVAPMGGKPGAEPREAAAPSVNRNGNAEDY